MESSPAGTSDTYQLPWCCQGAILEQIWWEVWIPTDSQHVHRMSLEVAATVQWQTWRQQGYWLLMAMVVKVCMIAATTHYALMSQANVLDM